MTANAITRSSLTPSRGVAVATANKSFWYPLHEGTGTSLADALGSGPTMTLGGTTPANGWTNPGEYAPNGTDNIATSASSAHMNSVLGLAQLASGGMLLCGYELIVPNASSAANQFIFWYGRDSATAGFGGWGLTYNSSDQVAFYMRGVEAGAVNSIGLGVAIGDSHTVAVKVLVTIWYESGYLRFEVRQSGTSSPGTIGTQQLDVSALTLPSTATDGTTLLARRTGASSYANFMGASTSGARVNNVWAQYRPTYSSTISALAYTDMVAASREFPRSLRG